MTEPRRHLPRREPAMRGGAEIPLPMIGEIVHFYELRNGDVYGPYAAIVTVVEGPPSNAVNLAVLGEAALRFVPLVPYNDGGRESWQWWTWAGAVDPPHGNQSGL
jgi:hypothetical protein